MNPVQITQKDAARASQRALLSGDGSAEAWPNVLIITAEVLNQSHGTGALLLNYFRDYPTEHLMSLYRVARGDAMLPQSVALTDPKQWNASSLRRHLADVSFEPDIVYAVPVKEGDLAILTAVLDCVREHVPVIMHCMDYIPQDSEKYDAQMRRLFPRVSALWGLTQSLCEMLSEKFGRKIDRVAALQQNLPAQYHTSHQAHSADFSTIMIGNFHDRSVIPLLKETWRICSENLSGLNPIQWYCHPLRRQAVLDAGYEMEPEIEWCGFVEHHVLQQAILDADLAILPFNSGSTIRGNYERYSIPSRLTEYAGAGTPMAIIASPDTEIARLTEEKGLGVSACGPEPQQVASLWTGFIQDPCARSAAGASARAFAEQEYGERPFQDWLLEFFRRLVADSLRM